MGLRCGHLVLVLALAACGGDQPACPVVHFTLDVQSEGIHAQLDEANITFDLHALQGNTIDQKTYPLCGMTNSMEIFDTVGNKVFTLHIPWEAIHVAASEGPVLFLYVKTGMPTVIHARIEYQTLTTVQLI